MTKDTWFDYIDDINTLCEEYGCVPGTIRLSWLRSQLEIARGHDARVTELLAANNHYLQQARDARADAKSWRDSYEMYVRAWFRELGGRIIRKSHQIDGLVLTTRHVVERARHADRLDRIAAGKRHGVYVASKTRHAPTWKIIRAAGLPIISTWIDEAGPGESADLDDLWSRCITESASAAVLILYREPDDHLKGGWVELGAALASGVPVFSVGIDQFTIAKYRRITHFPHLDAAVEAARKLLDTNKAA